MEEVIRQSEMIENDYVKKWKSEGKKVLGYTCVMTPAEVIEAAGLLPYRIRALGNPHTEMADAHLSRFNCSFCRSCLQLGLDGTYEFLDGLIESNGCDHLRGMFENWQYVKEFDFFHYLKVPHIMTRDAMEYFEGEMELYRKAIGEYFEVEITDRELLRVMEEYSLIRDKLRVLYEIREGENPGMTGAEALAVILLGSAVPAGVFLDLLDRVIEERRDTDISGYRARLILCGAATDEVDFIREIESVGGLVVTDALCYGSRAFWTVERGGEEDPLKALAHMYLENLLCPRMFDDYYSRRDYVLAAVSRANVDGAILVHNKFCDVHGVDNVQLRMDLEKNDIPVLQLEKEYGAKADLGRIKTRVQAFLEKIG
ncbi:MAG: 2-hydroxyacyl-CoA dehydratase family protein [Actinobacteria bacterium]|nr:2-hydroxyacyl-CoA dehydratase family protein [Actinomycetota bacterium]MCG2820244.1 2-hydroxyacyl-CoA dehydratase family protein [Actinomycetes bacterium]MBU4219551.1 2-hydroxyacyl-CoA dehydratase family protein [Actinomycetota bacterium]MBU4358119.1 2-hydroxyacyl-CoA dehydratase family protein [Actinomycetota bacterium]MBU4392341.1 2-hydroxyacyl-CoA dehydratase family protein [Actinomycetota bacterium]